MLKVQNVSVSLGSRTRPHRVLHDVSFSCGEGEIVAVIGRSGVGKTTLLRSIAGLVPLQSGCILLGGQAVRGPGHDRALVFQDYCVYPWLTVRGNVALGLNVQTDITLSERTRAVDTLLQALGLTTAAHYFAHQVSGGMQQRVALARALAVRPQVLLLDEPFAALDALTREEAQDLIRKMLDELRQTILLVTHDIADAVRVANKIIVLSGHPGKIVKAFSVSQKPAESDGRLDLIEMIKQTLRDG